MAEKWTDERVELLKLLWEVKGQTARQIAEALGGTTRNAVIGKAHRLRFSVRTRPKAPPKARKYLPHLTQAKDAKHASKVSVPWRQTYKRVPIKVAKPDIDEPPSLRLPLVELTYKTCKWPGEKEQGGFDFCGHKTWNDKPYCEHHCSIAYQPPRERSGRLGAKELRR